MIDSGWWQLIVFMAIVAIPLLINGYFKLGLSRSSALAIARMTAQLI